MNSSETVPESAGVSDPGDRPATPQPFYWSVRRELWENRSIYVAPILVAIVVLFGFLVSTIGLPERRRQVLLLDPAKARAAIEVPYNMAAIMLILTAFIVGVFIVSTRCTANAAIAASCSGSRCRYPIAPRCSRRPQSLWSFCRW